jgi:hypothetical protein
MGGSWEGPKMSKAPLKRLESSEVEKLIEGMRRWPSAYHVDIAKLIGHLRWLERRVNGYELQFQMSAEANKPKEVLEPGDWRDVILELAERGRQDTPWFRDASRRAGFKTHEEALDWTMSQVRDCEHDYEFRRVGSLCEKVCKKCGEEA